MKRNGKVVAIASATGLAAIIATAAVAGGSNEAAGVKKDLARVRQATTQYHDVAVAEADGYMSTEECVSSPEGGMGVHYVNGELFGDGEVDLEHPDVLLYAPTSGGMKLVAVEYVAIDSDQNPDTVDDRPSLFGRPFDGPVAEPGGPVVYTLHAWLWRANPEGILEEWNPNIHCPAS